MPKALRGPKYKLSFSLDDHPPPGRSAAGSIRPPGGGTTHYPPAAGPAAGGRARPGYFRHGQSRKSQKQYFVFLGPFCPFLDNIVVISTMSAKFSTFWSCQTSILWKLQKMSFLLNTGYGIQNVEYGIWNTEFRIRSMECGIWNAEYWVYPLTRWGAVAESRPLCWGAIGPQSRTRSESRPLRHMSTVNNVAP